MALSAPGELLLPSVRTGTAMSRAPDKKAPPSRLPAKSSAAAAPANGAAGRVRTTGQQQQQHQQQQQQQQLPSQQPQLLHAQPLSYHAMATAIFHDNSRNIEEMFISAARDGDCERLQSFIAHRDGMLLSIDVRDKRSGNTPLIWAAKRGQTKAVTLLLAHGADPTLRNYDEQTALEVASPAIKQALLDSVERDGSAQLRLLQAAWQGNADAVRTLLDRHKDLVSVDHRNSDGFTALLLVARDVYLFEKLGPQLVSAYNPRTVIVELIQHNADVNICDYEGKTPLHYVAACKSSLAASLVSCLISASNAEKLDKRCLAPIHCACQAGNADVLAALLEAGCSVNYRGFGGTTPLHFAAYKNHDQVALTLLAHGADPHLVDDGGQAPADVARSGRIKRALRDARSAAALRTELRLAPVKVPGLRGSSSSGGSAASTGLDAERRDGEAGQTLGSAPAGRHDEDGYLYLSAIDGSSSAASEYAGGVDAIRKLGTTRGQQRPIAVKTQSSKDVGALSTGTPFRGSVSAPQQPPPLALPPAAASAELLILRGSSSLGSLQRDRTLEGGGIGGRDDGGLNVSAEAGLVTPPYPLLRSATYNPAVPRKSRYPPATPLYPLASVQDVTAACDTIIVKGRSSASSRRAADVDEIHITPDRRSHSLTPISSSSTADWGKLSSLGTVPESEGDLMSSPELTSASPCFTKAAGYAAAEPRAGTKLTFYSIGEESDDVTPRGGAAAAIKSPRSSCADQLLDGTALLRSSHFSIDQSRTAEHREAVTVKTDAVCGRADVAPVPDGIVLQAHSSPYVGAMMADVAMLTPAGRSRLAERVAIDSRASPTDSQRDHICAAEPKHDGCRCDRRASAAIGAGDAGLCAKAAVPYADESDCVSCQPTIAESRGGSGSNASGTSLSGCGREPGDVRGRMDGRRDSLIVVPALGVVPSLSTEPARAVYVPRASESAPVRAAASISAEPGGKVLQVMAASTAGTIESTDRLPSRYASGTEPRDYVVVASKRLYQPLTSLITMRLPGVEDVPYPESSSMEYDFRTATVRTPVSNAMKPVDLSSASPEAPDAYGKKYSSTTPDRRRSRSRSGSSDSSCGSVMSRDVAARPRADIGVRKDAAITISFRQHDGPVIEDVFESYPRRAYDLPNGAAISSRRPGEKSDPVEESKKKTKGKTAKAGKKKAAAPGTRGGGSGGERAPAAAAAHSSGKQRTSKQQKQGSRSAASTAAPAVDTGGAVQGSKRTRSGRRRRGHKKGGVEQPVDDNKPSLSPINMARESPTSTALISGIGWQLATRMNIVDVDREDVAAADHGTFAGEDPTGNAPANTFRQMSPTQKREELKRLLLAMRDSSSHLRTGSEATRLIPETMLAIHEFAKTVPDLEEHHEWDALFGLVARESRFPDRSGALAAAGNYGRRVDDVTGVHFERASSASGSASTFGPSAIAAARVDVESPAAAVLSGIHEQGSIGENECLAADDLDDIRPTDSGVDLVQQQELLNIGGTNQVPFHTSCPEDPVVKVVNQTALLTSDTFQDSSIAIRMSTDIEAAIDDILASPPLSPRRLLSKTLLAEIHSSWEEIAGSRTSKSNSISSHGSGASATRISGDRYCSPLGVADDKDDAAQFRAREATLAAATAADSASSWDDTIAYADALLREHGPVAGEAVESWSPPPPRCPLTIEPSSSKPPAASGPRTSAHSPKLAAAHGATAKTSSGRPSKHRPSATNVIATSQREASDGTGRLHGDGGAHDEEAQQQHLDVPQPAGDAAAPAAAGLVLMHSMAEDILSRPNSRTYTSRLGSRRSARSPTSTRRPHSAAMSEDSHGTATSLGTETAGEILRWKKGNVLGKGAFATVYCGLTSDGQLIAVKQLELNTDDWDKAEREYENIQDEVELLKTLRHRNIVGFLGTSLEDHVVNIFMQFIPGGTLSSLLSRFGAFEEQIFCRYTRQIVDGISYLHSNNVIHRDIKGANIMLMSNGVIKLIDFGCAKKLCVNLSLSASQLQRSMKGTPYWMAPEVVKETGHGKKSDIWSIGCTVFEMATTKPPWAEMQPMAAIFAIGSDRPVPQLPETFSTAAKEFVGACMKREPSDRPDAAALLAHPFVMHVHTK